MAGVAALGVVSTVLPSLAFAQPADLVSWLVGAIVLACGTAVWALGNRRVGLLLVAASAAWHLTDLARVLPLTLRAAVERATLVHIACLGVAVVMAVQPARSSRQDPVVWPLVLVFVAVAASGWTGGWQVTLPVAAAALLAYVVGAPSFRSRPTERGRIGAARAAGLVLAADLLTAAVVRRWAEGPEVERWLTATHETAVVATATLLALAAFRPRPTQGVLIGDDPEPEFNRTIAQALDAPAANVVLADEGAGWLGLNGRPAEVPAEPALAVQERAERVALVGLVGSRAVPNTVIRVLRLARDHARLRATIERQVDELATSRRRLLLAQDAARAAIERALREGPMADMISIRMDVAACPHTDDLVRSIDRALRNLADLSRTLDPMPPGRSLAEALDEIVEATPGSVSLSLHDRVVDHETARAVWFVVNEALTNVVKHARGASAHVTIDPRPGSAAGAAVVVSDDGPGGADPSGSGLRGLADRIEALGGRLRVVSPKNHGTRVEVEL